MVGGLAVEAVTEAQQGEVAEEAAEERIIEEVETNTTYTTITAKEKANRMRAMVPSHGVETSRTEIAQPLIQRQ